MVDEKCLSCPVRGVCCYFELYTFDDHRVAGDVPCEHLDVDTGLCTVFERRHQTNPGCLTIRQMLEEGTVPVECLYVKDKKAYQARTDRRWYLIKEVER